MNETSNWLIHDHHKYDTALDECELEAGAGEWKNAVRLFDTFIGEIKLHMRLEEEVLYPFFVKELGDPEGAITVLSEEHDELARLQHDLIFVIKTRDFDHFLDSLVPLHRAMKQHSLHEEEVFQRMGSDSLLLHRDEIMNRLKSLPGVKGQRTWEF